LLKFKWENLTSIDLRPNCKLKKINREQFFLGSLRKKKSPSLILFLQCRHLLKKGFKREIMLIWKRLFLQCWIRIDLGQWLNQYANQHSLGLTNSKLRLKWFLSRVFEGIRFTLKWYGINANASKKFLHTQIIFKTRGSEFPWSTLSYSKKFQF